VGDFYRGWIHAVRYDEQGRFVTSDVLATGMNGPADYAVEPATGWVYVASIIDDRIRRIRWSPVADVAPGAPRLALSPPAPNPMRGGTSFTLALPEPSRVGFEVLDAAGRLVWRAPAAEHGAGTLRLAWDGRDAAGARVAPGLYFARASAGGETLVRRVIALD
jgi:hypothetical protein